MDSGHSIFYQAKQLDDDVGRLLRPIDRDKLSVKEKNTLAKLKQSLTDTRIYAQAYSQAETKEDIFKNALAVKKCLSKTQACILSASETNIFGAIDVAHLSAQVEQLKTKL